MKYLPIFALAWACYAGQPDLVADEFIDEPTETIETLGENLARITYADKRVDLIGHEGSEITALRNMPVVSGSIIRNDYGAFSEIEFIDGSLMQIDDRTTVEFQAINEVYGTESLSVIRLHNGRVFLHVSNAVTVNVDTRVFRFDSQEGATYIDTPGVYEIEVKAGRMITKVYRGYAELSGRDDSVTMRSGQYSSIANMYRPYSVKSFNSFNTDKFERWAYDRTPLLNSVSSRYTDPAISSYSRDLDDNGEWRYDDETEVHVWVPYVSASWRPYWNGYWGRFGPSLTWVSYDSFGWVTHHYGRWHWRASFGWYWIPGRYYSPAWVAWSSYDSYVGWCPLGYWNRPFYYNRHRRVNTVVINNITNVWNYVPSENIRGGARSYTRAVVQPNRARHITTRRLYVKADDFDSDRSLTRIIQNPEENRARRAQFQATQPTLRYARRDSATPAEPVRIQSRDSGTTAVSRTRSSRVQYRSYDNGGARDNNGVQAERGRSDDTAGRRYSTQGSSRERGDTYTTPNPNTGTRVESNRGNSSNDASRPTTTRRYNDRNDNNDNVKPTTTPRVEQRDNTPRTTTRESSPARTPSREAQPRQESKPRYTSPPKQSSGDSPRAESSKPSTRKPPSTSRRSSSSRSNDNDSKDNKRESSSVKKDNR